MLRPETAHDVLELVRQSGLVDTTALAGIRARLSKCEPRDRAVTLLVAERLLTAYQVGEIVHGRGRGLWLGGYRVLDRIGKGGMSQVFLGQHAVLRTRAAIKVLSADLRADPIARKRFVREARAAAAIDHPNIVHVFDVDMDHDPPFLVMELVEGLSLQAAVAAHGTMTGGEAAAIGAEVARGLAVAAAAGLVHRDIKPANLLLDRQGGVKILDLGIVRLVGDDTHPPGTENEQILGTIDYLAPEQAENSARVDPRADLYALGATLYFLLAGHPPFPSADIRHKLAAKRYSDPPPIHRLRPDTDPELSEVIQVLMARDLTSRCQSATDAAESLARFAAIPAGFPARYFRPTHHSTVDDSKQPESSTLPLTQCLRRPSSSANKGGSLGDRSADGDSGSSTDGSGPPTDLVTGDDPGPPTLRTSKALTDLVMDALPANYPLPQASPPTVKTSSAPLQEKKPAEPSLLLHRYEWLAAILLAAVVLSAALRYLAF